MLEEEITADFNKLTKTVKKNPEKLLSLIKLYYASKEKKINFLKVFLESKKTSYLKKLLENPESIEDYAEYKKNNLSKSNNLAFDEYLHLKNKYFSYQKKHTLIKVPKKFKISNIPEKQTSTYLIGMNVIRVGADFSHGLFIPKNYGYILFNQLYNCPPLISLVKNSKEHIAFLHVYDNKKPKDVDDQVNRWMKKISDKGDVLETIFAPRKAFSKNIRDTGFITAIDTIKKHSKNTFVYARIVNELEGIINKKGIYFCTGKHYAWEN